MKNAMTARKTAPTAMVLAAELALVLDVVAAALAEDADSGTEEAGLGTDEVLGA